MEQTLIVFMKFGQHAHQPMNDEEKLHVEYEGDSPENYPGNNEFFSVGGWDYDRRDTMWRRLRTK